MPANSEYIRMTVETPRELYLVLRDVALEQNVARTAYVLEAVREKLQRDTGMKLARLPEFRAPLSESAS